MPSFDGEGALRLTKVQIICKEARPEVFRNAMTGCGMQKGKPEYCRGIPVEATPLLRMRADTVVSRAPVRSVIETDQKALYTGHVGGGRIFVCEVENAVRVRTGEKGHDALQDAE